MRFQHLYKERVAQQLAAIRCHNCMTENFCFNIDNCRYLKLFPFINDHDDGLRRLAEYLKKEIGRIGQDQIKVRLDVGSEQY